MDRRGAELGMAPISRQKNREVLEAAELQSNWLVAAGVRVGFGTDLMGVLEDEQSTASAYKSRSTAQPPPSAPPPPSTPTSSAAQTSAASRTAASRTAHPRRQPVQHPSVLWAGRRTVVQAGTVI